MRLCPARETAEQRGRQEVCHGTGEPVASHCEARFHGSLPLACCVGDDTGSSAEVACSGTGPLKARRQEEQLWCDLQAEKLFGQVMADAEDGAGVSEGDLKVKKQFGSSQVLPDERGLLRSLVLADARPEEKDDDEQGGPFVGPCRSSFPGEGGPPFGGSAPDDPGRREQGWAQQVEQQLAKECEEKGEGDLVEGLDALGPKVRAHLASQF